MDYTGCVLINNNNDVEQADGNDDVHVFNDWKVYPSSCELEDKDGAIYKIEPRIMTALCYFLANVNIVVSRDQLIDAVWQEKVTVSDHSLTQLLGNLRKVLGDSSKKPKYIETIPKKGYRFIGKTVVISAPGVDNDIDKSPENFLKLTTTSKKTKSIALFTLVILIATMLFAYSAIMPESKVRTTVDRIDVSSLTNFPGVERFPAVSPDGKWLVFSWENHQKPSNIFLSSLDDKSVKPIQLTNSNVKEMRPVWSPDSKNIAFVRITGENECAVIKLNIATRNESFLVRCGDSQFAGDTLAWAPDGSIYFKSAEKNTTSSIGIYKQGTSNTLLPCRFICHYEDMDISWAPSGEHFVVTRQISLTGQDLFLYSADLTVPETRISFDEVQILGHSFSDDGKTLFYSTLKNSSPEIWQYDVEMKTHAQLTSSGVIAIYPSVWRGANKLVFSKQERIFYIGQTNISLPTPIIYPLVQSYSSNFDPSFDMHSNRVAYTSDISGHSEVWLSKLDGSEYQQITQSKVGALSPSWSDDGSKLAYVLYDTKEHGVIQWLDTKTELVNVIDTELTELWGPQFNYNQDAILVSGSKDNQRYIWEISLDDNSVKAVSGEGAYIAKTDKKSGVLYYNKENQDGLWRFDTQTAKDVLVIPDLKPQNQSNWLPYEQYIYYLDNKNQKDNVMRFNLITKRTELVSSLPKNSVAQYAAGGFSMRKEADNHYLIFVHNGVFQGDIMMADIK